MFLDFVFVYTWVYWRNNEDGMWSSQSLSWKCGLAFFISTDMEMCTYIVICYTYCYILDMLFLTTGLPMWICFISSTFFFSLLWGSLYISIYCPCQHGAIYTYQACNNCTSCKFHPALFCQVFFVFYRSICDVHTLIFEAVAKYVSFNLTGTHRSLVHTPPVHMYSIYCINL